MPDPRRRHRFIKTGEFQTALVWFAGIFHSEGTASDARDFRFKYRMEGPETNFTTEYTHSNETWRFTASSTVAKGKNVPVSLDFTSVAQFRGDVPAAYGGRQAIGNYIAPNMATTVATRV
jgi:hypothetical protein